jgi:hypothetical protein
VILPGTPSLQRHNYPMVMIPLAELIEDSKILKDLDIHKCLIKHLGASGISHAESISKGQTMTIGAKQTALDNLEEK